VLEFLKNFFKSSHGSSFRTDIAGIRGIAVMLVVLCHFEIPGFGGGFLGPDIFFVLSGYLITGLLVKEYNKNISKRSGRGKISIGAFYLRRTRRILPASLFVLICVNIYARLNMNVLQVAQIKTDSIWTVFFGANINFLRQATDYFAQNNAVSPLQHYWSLSVEEQFYFVWPVLLLTAGSFHKLSIRGRAFDAQQRLRAVFIAMGIGSFVWMLVEFTNSPTTAYFSTFSRAWELALGGALSLISVEGLAAKLGRNWTILRGVALVAMVGSIAFVSPTNFGYTLFVPAVATGFLLISGAHAKGDPVYRLLSAKPLTALGAISFSLYLWHWPVFVFGRNLDLMNTLPQRFIGVLMCIGLGTLSYWLIERTFLKIPLPTWKPRPNYNGRSGLATSRIFTSAVTALVVAGLGLVTYPSESSDTQVAAWVPPASAQSFAPVLETTSAPKASNYEVLLSSRGKLLRESILNAGKPAQPILADNISKFGAIQVPNVDPIAWPCQKGLPAKVMHCWLGGASARENLVVIGDSHAMMWMPALRKVVAKNDSLRIDVFAMPGCNNSLSESGMAVPTRSLCPKTHGYALDYLSRHPQANVLFTDNGSPIALVDQWQTGYASFIKTVKHKTNHVSILGFVPAYPKALTCLSKDFSNIQDCGSTSDSNVSGNEMLRKIAVSQGVDFINVIPWFCVEGVCPLAIDGVPVSLDGNHLVYTSAAQADSLLAAALSYLLPKQQSTTAGSNSEQLLKDWKSKLVIASQSKTLPSPLNPQLESLPSLGKNLWNCAGGQVLASTNTHVCTAGNLAGPNQALLLGDSHARVLWPLLLKSLDLDQWGITFLGQGNCPFSDISPLGKYEWNRKCNQHREFTWKIARKLRPKLLVAADSNYSVTPQAMKKFEAGYTRSFGKLLPVSQNIVFVGQTPGGANLIECVGATGSLSKCPMRGNPWKAVQDSQRHVAQTAGAHFFDLTLYLCTTLTSSGKCPPFIGNVGTYLEGNHLTEPLVEALAPFFKAELHSLGINLSTLSSTS